MIETLIVGLGNPGDQYMNTPHNVGFATVTEIARALGNENFTSEKKFSASVVRINDLLLIKPETYMNHSGQAVGQIMKYYQIPPAGLFVIHDDFDIALGKLKISIGKSGGNHGGILSIEQHLKTNDFARFRIGIGKPGVAALEQYVLAPFTKAERPLITHTTQEAAKAIIFALENDLPKAMTRFNNQ